MKKTIIATCFLFILSVMTMSSLALAAGVYDGTWQGKTASGQAISFVVENDVVTTLQTDVVYTCANGATSMWGHGRNPNALISEKATFTYIENVDGSNIINGSTFAVGIGAQFKTTSLAVGTIKSFAAAFQGSKAATQACSANENFSVKKAAVTPASADSITEEYNREIK